MNSTNIACTEKRDKRVSNSDRKDCQEEDSNWSVVSRKHSILFPQQQKRTNTDKDQFSFLSCISKANSPSLFTSNMVNAEGHFCSVPACSKLASLPIQVPSMPPLPTSGIIIHKRNMWKDTSRDAISFNLRLPFGPHIASNILNFLFQNSLIYKVNISTTIFKKKRLYIFKKPSYLADFIKRHLTGEIAFEQCMSRDKICQRGRNFPLPF